jgi:hypothetical protein
VRTSSGIERVISGVEGAEMMSSPGVTVRASLAWIVSERGGNRFAHDRLDAGEQMTAARAARGNDGRAEIQAAYAENGVRVGVSIVTRVNDGLVARSFAFRHEPRADPPHERVKPEQDFGEGVKRGGQVVASLRMRRFVSNEYVELLRLQRLEDVLRQQQRRPQNAEHAGLDAIRRNAHGKRCVE